MSSLLLKFWILSPLMWNCPTMYLQQSYKTKASSCASESLLKKYTSLNLMTCFFEGKMKFELLHVYHSKKNDKDGIHST